MGKSDKFNFTNVNKNWSHKLRCRGGIYFGLAEKREQENEGQYYFVSGVNITWTNWDSGQPDNYYNEDCANMRSNGKWNDIPCSYSYPFVCEKGNVKKRY